MIKNRTGKYKNEIPKVDWKNRKGKQENGSENKAMIRGKKKI